MDEIRLSLTSPALSASIEVPAGTARAFEAVAKDSAGKIRYIGRQSVEIVAGATIDLSIQMSAVYALSYDANGADSGIAPATLYKTAGEAVSVAPNSGGLARTGYSFAGWNTAADGTGTDYPPGLAIEMPASDLILYAKWLAAKEIVSFSITSPVSATGVIIGSAISITVPFGTSVLSMTPAIIFNGSTCLPGPGVAQDFTSPVVYTVTAADSTTATYTVTVTVGPSNVADLAAVGGLTVNSLPLSPTFVPTTLSYTASASSSFPTVSVTPTAADAGASIQVRINGGGYTAVASGSTSGTLILDAPNGTNVIEVLVTAADAATTRLYTVTVSKTVAITIGSGAGGAVSPSGTFEYTPGTPYGIVATPTPGYRFVGWTGTATVSPVNSASATLMVSTVNQDATATFTPDFSGGDGSPGSPFQVTNLAELKNANNFRSASYVLMANIDTASEANWAPIGDAAIKFTGTFDGNGMTISNLTINAEFDQNRGLFGFVQDAVISNLTLTGVNIIKTADYAGSLIGQAGGATQVTNCSASGTIEAYQTTGGLIGYCNAGSSVTVSQCWTDVTISSRSYGSLGGLIGRTEGGSVQKCYALGSIGPHVGGATWDYVGGLIGWNQGAVINSYARGAATGSGYVGGLVAYNTGASANVTNCYSTGALTGASDVGGLIGFNTLGTITASIYDTTTSGQSDTGKGEPQTTANMQDAGNVATYYPGWDFATIWQIIATAYPTLR